MIKLKFFDYVVITLAFIFSITFIIFSSGLKASEVVIEVNGQPYARYPVSENRIINVSSKFGESVVVIEKQKVYVRETTCEDKIEVKAGTIERSGQSLICLPNKTVIFLEGESDSDVNTY